MGGYRSTGEIPLVQIFVRDNNVDQALKALKKKMQREGTFREMKRRNHYEKPSEKRARTMSNWPSKPNMPGPTGMIS